LYRLLCSLKRRNCLIAVEYLWSHWNQHELANSCPITFGQLSASARQALRRMNRRATLVYAYWKQAELFPM